MPADAMAMMSGNDALASRLDDAFISMVARSCNHLTAMQVELYHLRLVLSKNASHLMNKMSTFVAKLEACMDKDVLLAFLAGCKVRTHKAGEFKLWCAMIKQW